MIWDIYTVICTKCANKIMTCIHIFQRSKLLSTLDYDNAVKFDFLTVNIYFLLNSQWKCCFKINHLRPKVKNIWLNCNIERNPCSINCIYQAVDTWWRHQMEIFPRHWLCVRGIHRWPVNSHHKGLWRGALMFSFICGWIHGFWRHCNESFPTPIQYLYKCWFIMWHSPWGYVTGKTHNFWPLKK